MSKARDIADLDFNSPDIDGGNIDGATIGATTPAAGTFNLATVDGARIVVQRQNDDSSIAFANNSTGTASGNTWAIGLDYDQSESLTFAFASNGFPSLSGNKVFQMNQNGNATFTGNVGIGVADGDVTGDGNSARTYVGIIGTGNRGRLNLGSTASNGADAGTLAFTNGANVLADITIDTTAGVQNTGTMYITGTRSIKIQAASSDEVVFNEGSTSSDFRVESTDNANMIKLDGTNNRVGIGKSPASNPFEISGFTSFDSGISVATKVNVGTTASFAPLYVKETGWSSGAPYGTVQLIEGQAVNDDNWGHLVITDADDSNGNGGSISFATGASNALNPFAGIKGRREGSNYGALDFFTRKSGATSTRRMVISSVGDITYYADGAGVGISKILPRITPNYPNAGQHGTFENYYQPPRGESGIIYFGSTNNSGGEYRLFGTIEYSAAEANNTPPAISIVIRESIGASRIDFDVSNGYIRVKNTYGYGTELMGWVHAFNRD